MVSFPERSRKHESSFLSDRIQYNFKWKERHTHRIVANVLSQNETLIREAGMPIQSEAEKSVCPSDKRLLLPKQTQRDCIPMESYWG
jgi:hypothetical protein